MSDAELAVTRLAHALLPDPRRVIAKPYLPGEELMPRGDTRAALLMQRILAIPEPELASVLAEVLAGFSARHHAFERMLERHFDLVAHHVPVGTRLTRERRLLIGAYFTHEYSIEGAALCNPSMVPAPDQSNLRDGECRFVMSLRAIGEGHVSSIEFRSGILDAAGEVTFDPLAPQVMLGRRTMASSYDQPLFRAKLIELGSGNDIAWSVLAQLPQQFTLDELERALTLLIKAGPPQAISYETARIIRALAASNYVTTFPDESTLGERVIFPAGPHETRGMEDARFVRFVEDDGAVKYYATYTAYDGFQILPQLIETDDFRSFTISTLNGAAAQNKGMALFPRRIGGKYVMLSRRDRENLHLATSTHVRFWNDVMEVHRPSQPWELVQIGNCGSPIETAAGWLVLTHGVGPMRRYVLGALLLDLDDPRRVIGQLPVPLLAPDAAEREGYVPNVLYSCGGLLHGDTLVLPYGFSDHGIRLARIAVPELLSKLQHSART